jgi:hypothetical protein
VQKKKFYRLILHKILMTDFQAPEEVNSYSERAMLAFWILNPGPLTQLRL